MQWDLDEDKLAWTNTGCSKWKWMIENYMFFEKHGCLVYSHDLYLHNINSYYNWKTDILLTYPINEI